MQPTQATTSQTPLEAKQEAARQALADLRRDLHFYKEAAARWKLRHANQAQSTMLVVGALLLIIAAESFWLLRIYQGGVK